MDFQERDTPSLAESTQSSKPSSTQQASELWEVMEEPRGRLGSDDIIPERQEGHLLKKRKWPLKGWHKRYFVLEDGILHYATTRQDITKGKVHGSIDVRLSVMSINKKAQRIDLDAEDNIYHLKIKSQDLFHSWVAQLRAHRLAQRLDMPSATHRKAPGTQMLTAGSASALPGVGPREKVSSWLRDSDGLDRCSHALSECQGKLQELHRLLQSLESLHRIPSAPVIPTHQASVTTERPKKGKRTSRMWCTQGFAKDDTIGRVGRLHGSVPNLSRYLESRDASGPRGLPPPDYAHLQRSFWALAQKVHNSLSSVLVALTTERDRLRDLHQGSELSRMAVSEIPDGQRRLHSLSISSDTTADSFSSLNPEEQEALYMKGRELTPQLSQSSVLSLADSHTEFFDACEVLLSASSSENEGSEEEESCASEITTSLSEEVLDIRGADRYQKGDRGKDETQAQLLCSCIQQWKRPVGVVLSPAAHANPQDITSSQMPQSPPVAGNAGMSQEGLLWDPLAAAACLLPVGLGQTLACGISFVTTSAKTYPRCRCPCSSTSRSTRCRGFARSWSTAASWTRPAACPTPASAWCTLQLSLSLPTPPHTTGQDASPSTLSWERLMSVSHHPPISACHAESENFIFWQDMKWKNKFWGKSLEIVPVGTVNVSLPRFGDHFEWNKVTSCIHNILSGQRWIEHYGEVLIRNTQDSSCHCKITFCKAKYWSSNIHEVQGAVLSKSGRVLHRLFGKWHEGLYRGPPPGGQCIWKPNSMPPDHERNFGFTQFALELNELTAELKRTLPSTDTRLRPDQRYLEEGNIQAAEAQKRRIEQLQRDRRRVMEENNIVHQARFFRRQTDSSGKEWWVTNHTYWRLRAEPGYGNLDGAVLW
ncbi:oxysterol-binding protein-related protein 7 isoform X2 [Mastomys coucha]|uniref:oxysterol-binding protein-related protein 7 isoform X2 n=1 Tax=Mastomys coucha TaxID=35658 RepID=UPI0012619154|nr:oxysterol-binding protein-related protein 7 isoform X2 [Mastomys coucha]